MHDSVVSEQLLVPIDGLPSASKIPVFGVPVVKPDAEMVTDSPGAADDGITEIVAKLYRSIPSISPTLKSAVGNVISESTNAIIGFCTPASSASASTIIGPGNTLALLM